MSLIGCARFPKQSVDETTAHPDDNKHPGPARIRWDMGQRFSGGRGSCGSDQRECWFSGHLPQCVRRRQLHVVVTAYGRGGRTGCDRLTASIGPPAPAVFHSLRPGHSHQWQAADHGGGSPAQEVRDLSVRQDAGGGAWVRRFPPLPGQGAQQHWLGRTCRPVRALASDPLLGRRRVVKTGKDSRQGSRGLTSVADAVIRCQSTIRRLWEASRHFAAWSYEALDLLLPLPVAGLPTSSPAAANALRKRKVCRWAQHPMPGPSGRARRHLRPWAQQSSQRKQPRFRRWNRPAVAVRVGFEPTEPAKAQRFSRPPDSTTLAPHRGVGV